MTTTEAKERLLLYRGEIDDDDPQFKEALSHAEADPEVAAWLREQTDSYGAVRSKLREIEPADDLKERIILEKPIQLRRNWGPILKLAAGIALLASLVALWTNLSRRHSDAAATAEKEITVRGEVLDMACYIAYNYSGADHAECARDCIRKGLPVGIKGEDGKTYLLIGATQPVNGELADYAAKTVTVRGKASMRDGFAQLEVIEIRKF
jgi:hypothetical protein